MMKTKFHAVTSHFILAFYSILCLYPLYFSIMSAFKRDIDIFGSALSLPSSFHFDNFIRAWEQGKIGRYFLNTIYLSVATVIVTAFISGMAAFVISRFRFKGKGFIYVFFIAGLMIPFQSAIVPLVYLFGQFNWMDSYNALIMLMSGFGIPFTLMILVSSMVSIPVEIEEAAIIDGCSIPRLFWSIILRISIPAIMTASIFNFIWSWNNMLMPLLFISNNDLKTISLGILSFTSERTTDYSAIMAAIVITILPPIAAYIFMQEKVEKGMTAGAVKG